VQLFPEGGNLAWISTDFLADKQRAVTVHDAVGDEPVGGEMRVRAGEAIASEACVGVDGHAGRTPMRKRVCAVGDSAARDGRVQDERLKPGDLHRVIRC